MNVNAFGKATTDIDGGADVDYFFFHQKTISEALCLIVTHSRCFCANVEVSKTLFKKKNGESLQIGRLHTFWSQTSRFFAERIQM
jgi:hypothetical protein